MLTILTYETLKILKRMENLEYREIIILPREARIDEPGFSFNEVDRAAYRQILANARNGIREFIAESGAKYDLTEVLDAIMPPERQRKEVIRTPFNE